MNVCVILTDTQNKSMVGAYGNPRVDTPHLDALAAEGVRFERAYTTCALCTPARSALFSGMHPPVNGAWCNNMAPAANVPLMGTIMRHYGYRAAYTGKWHLDGAGYFGNGVADGGFEPDWWYDGVRYAQEIGPEMFARYRTSRTPAELQEAGFTEETMWGHRVADRAVDFLASVGDDPFVLVVSFDEPHGPHVAPPAYWEAFQPGDIPKPPNYNAPLDGKPALQQLQRRERGDPDWLESAVGLTRFFGCNSYIDREIGRVLDAIDRWHGDDTVVIYTADHGEMMGAHGLREKGPMVYEEICNIPFIVRLPDGPRGAVSRSLVSHLDLLPTVLDLAGIQPPESLQGVSLRPVLEDTAARVRDHVLMSYTRFAINHDDWGGFYPIRCLVDDRGEHRRYKLAINLLDSDELYDLESDPYELRNQIDNPEHADARDRLHATLLDEMDRIRDPFRGHPWAERAWGCPRVPFYHGGARRNRPSGFSFEPASLEADGSWSGR